MVPHGSSALSTCTWKTELRRRHCRAPTCVISFWRISTPCTSFTARRVESGVRIARKHLGWYCALLDEPAEIRRDLMGAASTAAQFAHALKHFESWVSEAAVAA